MHLHSSFGCLWCVAGRFSLECSLITLLFLREAAKICGQFKRAGQDMLSLLILIRTKQAANILILAEQAWEYLLYVSLNLERIIIMESGLKTCNGNNHRTAVLGPAGMLQHSRRWRRCRRQGIQRDYHKFWHGTMWPLPLQQVIYHLQESKRNNKRFKTDTGRVQTDMIVISLHTHRL